MGKKTLTYTKEIAKGGAFFFSSVAVVSTKATDSSKDDGEKVCGSLEQRKEGPKIAGVITTVHRKFI